MLITFTSKAAAEFIIYQDHVRGILEQLGKSVERGVFVPDEIPHAIDVIETAVNENRKHPISDGIARDVNAHHNESGDDVDHEKMNIVSLSTRMYPLLEMLRAALKMQTEVMWAA